MQEINFTIVAMIYNIEKYLPMCIESIMAQKGDDIEIILVDDGSTDSSSEICDKYAKEDMRIRVIHQKNAGVSAARNTAIDNARGKWLIQVDGDDVLVSDAIERCRKYINTDADLLQFDTVEFIDSPDLSNWVPKSEEIVIEGDLLKEYHLQLIDRSQVKTVFPTYNLNPAWSKMWNMDFIRKNNLHYDSNVIKGEGTLFTFTSSYYFKKVIIVPELLYGYRINPNSIMHRFSANILENQNIQYRAYQKVFEEHKESNEKYVKSALLKRGLYLIENAIILGIAHPDCHWKKQQCLDWCNSLCALDWVQESVKYAISNGYNSKIFNTINQKDYGKFYQRCMILKIKVMIKKYLATIRKLYTLR